MSSGRLIVNRAERGGTVELVRWHIVFLQITKHVWFYTKHPSLYFLNTNAGFLIIQSSIYFKLYIEFVVCAMIIKPHNRGALIIMTKTVAESI